MNLLAFAARRVAGAAVLLVLLSAAVFAATAVLPGDAVSAVAGVDASEADVPRSAPNWGWTGPPPSGTRTGRRARSGGIWAVVS